MFTLTLKHSKRALLAASLLMALLLCMTPMTFAADTGHIGEKPAIGQGDGIPQPKPGTIRAGEQLVKGSGSKGDGPGNDGQQNNSGDASHGDYAIKGGDGIPNGGPIEGTGHRGQGVDASMVTFGLLSWLF